MPSKSQDVPRTADCADPCYTRSGWRWDIPEEDMALAAVSDSVLVLQAQAHASTGQCSVWLGMAGLGKLHCMATHMQMMKHEPAVLSIGMGSPFSSSG